MNDTRARRMAAWCVGALFTLVGQAHADVFQPAYLELREQGHDVYAVLWRVPAQDPHTRLALDVVLPEGTTVIGTPMRAFVGTAVVERWRVHRAGGLQGQTVRITGRAAGVTDVIARVQRQDGSSQVERLRIDAPAFVVKRPARAGEVAWSYLVLGVEHILRGADHLLFVFALLLTVRGTRRVLATITAFTAAHSLTLGAAALRLVTLPGPPVEAVIALSIVFVAREALRDPARAPGLTSRAPWVVAFAFGLLHGLGFAGALAEVGLPQTAIAVALVMFNVGVEIGQVFFVGVVLLVMAAMRRLPVGPPQWVSGAVPWAVGATAVFWVIERVAAF